MNGQKVPSEKLNALGGAIEGRISARMQAKACPTA
jgi:hypothetical protein